VHGIDDTEVFCRVVEKGSFSDAGRSLRVSTAVVSARIAKLESKLGVRLLNRTTRAVNPTDAGQIYYTACKEINDRLSAVHGQLQELQGNPQGVIKITAPDALGQHVIAPLLAEFQDEFPGVEIRLHVADRVVNLVDEQIDLAIRHGRPEDSSMVMRPLAADRWIVAGAPSYFAERGRPQSLTDLHKHECLLLRFHGSRQFQWTFDSGQIEFAGSMDASTSSVLATWAKLGKGLAQQSIWSLYDHLESGALEPVLTQHEPSGLSINAFMPERQHRPAKINLLLDFLEQKMREHPALGYL
jgi:DNA-binding transcriptional LysR family regulator